MATAAGRTARAPEQARQPRTKVRWSIVALCFLGLTINYDSGARAGTALALPVVTALVAWLGWRWSFVVTGAIGFVWVAPAEVEYIEEGGARAEEREAEEEGRETTKVRYRDLFRCAMSYLFSVGRIEPLPVRTD